MTTIEVLYSIYQKHSTVVTDTRQIVPGSLFFALKGDKFDGNAFAAQALERGAAFAVVDDPKVAVNDRFLLVADVLTALQALATHHRRQFEIPVIAITGSNGKTTTKELVAEVMGSHYPTHFTKGNLNNHIGVPLTLLAMPTNTEVAIIEMGANHVGEIDFLCNLAEPTHGLITNIGKAHLEGFGGIEGVKQGKSELYRYLASHLGLVFVNKDEKYLTKLASKNKKKIFYTQSPKPDPTTTPFEAALLAETPFLKVGFLAFETGALVEIQTQIIGKYNFNNLMTAITLGKYFKVPSSKIKKALESYIPANNRSQIVQHGSNTYILDAYNANPTSMANALENLRDMKGEGKVAILGDMLELGTDSPKEHRRIAQLAQQCGLEKIILVGSEFGANRPSNADTVHFPTASAAKEWLGKQHFEKKTILVKGSRGIKLETILL